MFFDLPPEPPKIWLPPKPALIRRATPDFLVKADNAAIIRHAQEDVRRETLARSRRRAAGNTAVAPATLVYAGSTPSTADATTYTFTNHAIGTAAADRLVVGVFNSNDSSTGGSPMVLSSATIGGSAASVIVAGPGTDRTGSAIFALPVAAGTTSTITVTLTQSAGRAALSVYAIYGLQSYTPFDFDGLEGSGATGTLTPDVPENGVLIAGFASTSGGTTTWVGATEDYDAATESRNFGAASAAGLSAQTARTVSATTTSGNWAMSVATWS